MAATADVIVAGRDSVDIVAAVTALAGRGHRRILTEGGPYLLTQIIDAGLLDDLCLTLSPVLAGPGADRIVADIGPRRGPGARTPARSASRTCWPTTGTCCAGTCGPPPADQGGS